MTYVLEESLTYRKHLIIVNYYCYYYNYRHKLMEQFIFLGRRKKKQVKVLVAQSCLTLCNPTDYSQPGSSVHGILQARILKWVAMPSSRGSD